MDNEVERAEIVTEAEGDPGAETDEDAGPLELDALREAVVTGSDWTTETILNQLRRDNIDLNVRFQRREVWKAARKSRFIESILLNLPIPQLVLAARRDNPNRFIVLDGKQRLLTLSQFEASADDSSMSSEDARFLLSNLPIRPDLDGKGYTDLEPIDRDAFDNHTIRTVVIRNWQEESVLHHIFHRLNTSNVQLSPQELRQALLPGPFVDFVDEFAASSEAIHKALGIEDADFRMRDTEIAVRFFSFANFIQDYRGDLKSFLDSACLTLNQDWEDRERTIKAQAEECENAISSTFAIFGEDAFHSWRDGAFEGRFNRAVYDVMTFYFRSATARNQALRHRTAVKSAFVRLCRTNTRFLQSITSTTKSQTATFSRLLRWGRTLQELGVSVDLPRELASAARRTTRKSGAARASKTTAKRSATRKKSTGKTAGLKTRARKTAIRKTAARKTTARRGGQQKSSRGRRNGTNS